MQISAMMPANRCSRLPLLSICAASAAAPEITIDDADEPARLGNAVHEILAERVKSRPWSIEEAAFRWRVPEDEIAALVSWGWRYWQQVERWYPDPQTEVKLAIPSLTGTVDLLSVVGEEVRILDWKSGRIEADATAQLRGYGLLALRKFPECVTAHVSLLNIRTANISRERYTRPQLEQWWLDMGRHLDAGVYTPGLHCGHCPRGMDCPAKTRLVRQATSILLDTEMERLALTLPADPAERGAIWDRMRMRVKLVKDCCELVEKLHKADVALHGGVLPSDDPAWEWRLTAQERRTIEFGRGWPILQQAGLRPADLESCISVGKTKLEDLIRANAGRGQKGKAVKEIMDRLNEAGAIATTTIDRLERRRVHTITADNDGNALQAAGPGDSH